MIKFTWLKKALFMVALVTAVAVVIAGVPVQTWAQVISGDLVGTVLDPSGASIAKATVTATHVTTGAKTTIATNDRGEYHFVNLPVGTYTVSASATGFNTSTVKNFEVQLNRTATANFNLKVGAQQTEIVVTGEAPPIDTTTAQVQTTYDTRALGDLPTAAGNILNLSLLQAGVASPGGVGAGTGPSVGGQRSRSNNFTVEGVDNNDKGVTGPQITIPNDSVENFTILQNQFSPEFGHSMGGQFNQTIKSGTNTFHGTVYEYLQNRNLNAVDYDLSNQGILKNPRFDNNRWGFNVGGPVQKNKIFFFLNFERNPIGATGTPASAVYSPTAAGYTTLAALPGISANNLGILKLYAAPAAASCAGAAGCPVVKVAGTSIPVGVLPILGPNFSNSGAWVSAGDINISEKNQLRVRYAHTYAQALDIAATLPVFWSPLGPKNDLFTMSEYHTFSPNISNEVRLGFNRVIATFPVGSASFPGLDVFPNLTFEELNLQLGPDPNAPQGNIYNHYQAAEAIAIQHGRHSLKFGFEFHKAIAPETFVQRLRGDYDYNTLDLYLRDLAPDHLGERSVGISAFYGDQISTYWYANDNWRITPRLSLNLGIRYEYVTIPFTDRLQSLNKIADAPGFLTFDSPRAPTKNFAPRVGFSWDVFGTGKTSIRGGFGMAYDVLYDNIGLLATAPEFNTTCDVSTPPDLTANTFCPNNDVRTGFLAAGGLPPHNSPLTFASKAEAQAGTANYIPPDQKYPYSEEWNLGVQHVFGEKYSVEVRYLGSRGLHLNVQTRLNKQAKCTATLACLPTYTTAPGQAALDALGLTLAGVQARSNFVPAYAAAGFNGNNLVSFQPYGHSKYNSLAVQGQRRFSNGLQFQVAYTFSHTYDNATADFFSTVLTPRRPQDFQCWSCDYGVSALDRRHRISIAAVYDVPWMKHGNWFQRNLLGNWEFAPVWIFESPEQATVQSAQDANQNGDAAGDRYIINAGGNRNLSSSVTALCTSGLAGAIGAGTVPAGAACGSSGFLDVAKTKPYTTVPYVVAYLAKNPGAYYLQAGLGTFPNGVRNTLPMARIDNVDLTVLKRFNISERTKISFSALMLNALNHPQFTPGSLNAITPASSTIVTAAGVTNILKPGSPTFNQPKTAFPSNARTIALALKFIF